MQVREFDTTAAQAPASQVNAESVLDDAELHALLERHKDTFPDELPMKLPPEHNVYHTTPLKTVELPLPRKSYRFSRPETEELKRQVHSLLAKATYSLYGHPVLFLRRQQVVCACA